MTEFNMIKVNYKELSIESFSPYGTFVDLINPSGFNFGNDLSAFYRDMIQQELNATTASFSLCYIKKRRPLIIDCSEYHNYCSEAIIPLDGDILMHVAPADAGERVPTDNIEVFRVPRHTLVVLKLGVWHYLPFTYQCDTVNILTILPERAYRNDCHVFDIPKDKQIEIIGYKK